MKRKSQQIHAEALPNLPALTLHDLEKLRNSIKDNPRNLILFDLITQTDLRLKDLLRIKIYDINNLKIGDSISDLCKSTKSESKFRITERIIQSLNLILTKNNPSKDDFLFKSRKGSQHLTNTTVSHMIKDWINDSNLDGVFGFRSLRKVWQFYENNPPDNGSNKIGMLDNTLRPISFKTLQEQVYQQLLNAIVSGKIPPGIKLTARKLAKQMNVSQMPIREALLKLASLGYIILSKTGVVVNTMSKENLKEIFEIRLMLELNVAKKGCLNSSQKTLTYLENLHNQYLYHVEHEDTDDLLWVNRKFHFAIYEESNMPILMKIIGGLWDRVSPYLHIFIANINDYRAMTENHTNILIGMRLKDPETTCKWLEKDLIEAADFLYRNVSMKKRHAH